VIRFNFHSVLVPDIGPWRGPGLLGRGPD
jgi:hypothetical protein